MCTADKEEFSVKCEYEADENILQMILTPKYIIMYDESNSLNWITCYDPAFYNEKMILDKTYKIKGS
jgi:hypothetical protein